MDAEPDGGTRAQADDAAEAGVQPAVVVTGAPAV